MSVKKVTKTDLRIVEGKKKKESKSHSIQFQCLGEFAMDFFKPTNSRPKQFYCMGECVSTNTRGPHLDKRIKNNLEYSVGGNREYVVQYKNYMTRRVASLYLNIVLIITIIKIVYVTEYFRSNLLYHSQ